MYIIIFVVYLWLLYGTFSAIGMGGYTTAVNIMLGGVEVLILLFGLFATVVWGRKSFLKQESYKKWSYISMGFIFIILFLPFIASLGHH